MTKAKGSKREVGTYHMLNCDWYQSESESMKSITFNYICTRSLFIYSFQVSSFFVHSIFKILRVLNSFCTLWQFFQANDLSCQFIVHPWSFLPQDAEKSPVFSTLVVDVFGYLVVFRARGQKLAKVMATLLPLATLTDIDLNFLRVSFQIMLSSSRSSIVYVVDGFRISNWNWISKFFVTSKWKLGIVFTIS